MQKKDLISVIVPVYNVKPYLSECIESILRQKYCNFEVLLVDDGSTDGSGEMCDVFSKKDTRIKVIHKENGGLSSARNTGLEKSKGEYICFVDSDDIISDNYLKVLYENAKIYDTDVSMCDFIRFWDDKEFLPMVENISSKISRDDFVVRIMCSRSNTSLVIACNKLIRRAVAEKISFPVGKWHEDDFYVNQLIECVDSFAVSSAQLYFYRQRRDSIMGENNKDDPRHLVAIEAYKERDGICRRICNKKTYRKIIISRYIKKTKEKIKRFTRVRG